MERKKKMGKMKAKLANELEFGLIQDIEPGPEYEIFKTLDEIKGLKEQCKEIETKIKLYSSTLTKLGKFVDES
jgi:dihydroxyacetone kinase